MIVIALGANLPSKCGPPAATLAAALGRLKALGLHIVSVSPFYKTPAWPDPAGPPFVNAVAIIQTRLQPAELLGLLHEVETEFGRMRSAPNAPRTLDLDLIDHDGIVCSGQINLPHPRLAERSFVLVPLADIAPGWCHPVTREGVGDLLARLPDRNAPVRLP
ncbi:MAG: 2-amino-4-hydroxy-6-hydroxymethyldihydropteridine diphosphokinase [Alphaproteobacteria bacterium 64-11]|nr:2-amino-4-hydroxy-6-hydroxymethyldihydropteridine diphosphokinase [Alphaproteobacteria bacterium]OJU10621.1 MAG: 2-amino-4-hydroxy-6-hydroxymethyldihydropteridine diphosphokinase [Alphaproteobacteria bacterium 64-11]